MPHNNHKLQIHPVLSDLERNTPHSQFDFVLSHEVICQILQIDPQETALSLSAESKEILNDLKPVHKRIFSDRAGQKEIEAYLMNKELIYEINEPEIIFPELYAQPRWQIVSIYDM